MLDCGFRIADWQNLTCVGDEYVDSIIKDIRFAIKKLLQHPGFTLIAVLTLGLGIGATTAIFSAVNPVLLEPLPYPSANRLITIWYAGADGSRVEQAFGTYRELRNAASPLTLWP